MMGDYPKLTTDVIIYNENNEIILIKRKNNPYQDFWALPGGFVEYGETVENAAIREAKEETNIKIKLKELINVYSKPTRDERGHIITIAYTAIGNFNEMNANSDAKDIKKFNLNDIENIKLAFDHKQIIYDGMKKI